MARRRELLPFSLHISTSIRVDKLTFEAILDVIFHSVGEIVEREREGFRNLAQDAGQSPAENTRQVQQLWDLPFHQFSFESLAACTATSKPARQLLNCQVRCFPPFQGRSRNIRLDECQNTCICHRSNNVLMQDTEIIRKRSRSSKINTQADRGPVRDIIGMTQSA